MIDDPTPLKHPFDFFESPWWKDANRKLCVEGWPTYVVALNCMVRDAKSAYEQLRAENLRLREALKLGRKYLETKKSFEDSTDPDRFVFAQALASALESK